MAEGFLGRWSRRKMDVKEGRVPAEPELARDPSAQPSVRARGSDAGQDPAGTAGTSASGPHEVQAGTDEAHAAAAEAPPTLEDTQALTPESDFTRFVRRDVPADVKNAALKKLFADPHFNVMDGLDVYIDDYGKPDPLPESAVRQLATAHFLGWFREDERKDDPRGGPRDDAEDPAAASVAQSADGEAAEESRESPPPAGPDHGHADLQLQPDDAPGSPGARPGPG
ncbi:DUF3306 domain-containing protein [Ramlibacter sp.]|uniref:DUF3306 domain-containing protein n=1 Tax=Ramlibacter sp. TaxID=1917967 RepID=UPI002D43E5B0|nr:DUF3306 domain-containing protein [Ramlibacter sp.]HYD77465.1 DUF3306 domain-containing protein [Ramlibacter sp.]